MPVSQETLTILRAVRTSDVTDALDSLGFQQRYEMGPQMRPLAPGVRFAGSAHTAEYDLIDRPLARMSYEAFDERQYKQGPDGLWHEAGPWGAPDEVLVIDAKRTAAGILGSHNTLTGRAKGVVGYVIDGACRDSYECILQRTPVFCTVRSPAHPMGRIGPVTDNQPIVCAGVVVRPGDAIVADEDGVVVVPQGIADEVAQRARLIQEKDRPGRRALYERLGLPLDETVDDGVRIHPSADIHPTVLLEGNVTVGPFTKIDAGTIIAGHLTIGHHSLIRCNVVIRGRNVIGNYTHIYDSVCIEGGRPAKVGSSTAEEPDRSTIGDDCWINHGATMHGTQLGDGAAIGLNVCCDYNTRVGRGAVLANGSATRVDQVIPGGCFAEGVPAEITKERITDDDRLAYFGLLPAVWTHFQGDMIEEHIRGRQGR